MSLEIDAAVVRQVGGPMRIERVRLDEPRADEVLVRLVATGICHTDVTIMNRDGPRPQILGHEGAGVVAAVGAGVTRLAVGDHVVLSFSTCGVCEPCDEGDPAYCDHFTPMNFSGRRRDGSATVHDLAGGEISACFFGQSSFATHALAREHDVVKVAADVPLEHLAPFGCGIQTGAGTVMNVMKPGPKSTLAVFGVGAVGCAAVMAARQLGCGRIIAVDRHPSRLDLARSLGATEAIDTTNTDLAAALADLGGLDFAVETTGVPAVVVAAINALKTRGICALHGVSHDPRLELDIFSLLGGKTVVGVREGNADPQTFIPRLIELYRAGEFPVDRLIRTYRFEELDQAIADSESGRTVKPVLLFGEGP